MNRAACTIVSPNYLAYARTVSASYLAQHPGHRFFVLIVADLADPAPFSTASFTPVMLHEIGLLDVRSTAMMFDILELNTNVKPTFLKHLLDRFDLDAVLYFDPDIFVYAPMDPVFDALESGASAVLVPHLTAPVAADATSIEQDMLFNGTYNLGFAAVGRSQESHNLLCWWEARCLDLGFSEGRTGLFVDQKWMNLAPVLFSNVAVSRDAGLNMAYWNLQERTLPQGPSGPLATSAASGTVPLRFFHFSGLNVNDPASLSRNTNRFTLANRPDLQALFADYKAAVLAAKDPQLEALPYGFDVFSDGTTVTRLARRIYSEHRDHWRGQDPFNANNGFARFARSLNLVKGTVAPKKQTWSDFNPKDRRVETIHRILRLVLKAVGPHKYELLMRYLSHISVLRNQSAFLSDPNWPADERKK